MRKPAAHGCRIWPWTDHRCMFETQGSQLHQLTRDGEPSYEIYVKEKAILNNQQSRAYQALDINQKDAKQADYDKAKSWMCQTFFSTYAPLGPS